MKTRTIILAAVVTLMAAFGAANRTMAQQPIRGVHNDRSGNDKQAVSNLPDLSVSAINYPSANSIEVTIANHGIGSAAPCHLALFVLQSDSPTSKASKVFTVAVPAIKPRGQYTAKVNISPFTAAGRAFLARIDRSDDVKESDESNNNLFDHSKVVH